MRRFWIVWLGITSILFFTSVGGWQKGPHLARQLNIRTAQLNSASLSTHLPKGEASPWDMKALSVAPKFIEDPQRNIHGIKAIFYDGVPWKGKPTRVFAYYGLPKIKKGEKVPAMVLVHGGGGSAFAQWVQLWVSRGYAAISMDTCGCIGCWAETVIHHPRDEYGGPPGWGGFDQIEEPIKDQWWYHAVADVILANSLIRSFPQVDPNRIGITGISWGGVLTSIVAGVDHRFKFAAPVYGCGFLQQLPGWVPEFRKMGQANARKYMRLWDPSVYLPRARLPMLWLSSPTDGFEINALQKSYRLPHAPRTLCIRVGMPHGHGGPGETPKEIYVMAESLFRKGTPLARIVKSGHKGRHAWAVFKSQEPITKAGLNFTTDTGQWYKRKWKTIPAVLDAKADRVSARLPKGATAYYLNIVDDRDCVVSTEYETVPPNNTDGGIKSNSLHRR